MAQDGGERLQHFQAVVALASELDLSILHPPMASSSPTPLSSVSVWDSDRLKRVARWRPSEDPGTYLVRAYCKVILALEELDACSQHISAHARAAASCVSPNYYASSTAECLFGCGVEVCREVPKTDFGVGHVWTCRGGKQVTMGD